MIKLQEMTPDVYYNQSRDFQFIGRLFDVVLNSTKTNSDLLYALPISDNSDERLVDLMAMTLGFKSKHNYNVKQLTALCSAFCEILRNKGNMQSIKMAVNALFGAEGIPVNTETDYEDGVLEIYIPDDLTDLNLLRDLLVYILPAGVSCSIVQTSRINFKDMEATKVIADSSIEAEIIDTNKAIIPTLENEGEYSSANIKNKVGIYSNDLLFKEADDNAK